MIKDQGIRCTILAMEHYITTLNAMRKHLYVDDEYVIDNDLGLYEAILTQLKTGRWPQNR